MGKHRSIFIVIAGLTLMMLAGLGGCTLDRFKDDNVAPIRYPNKPKVHKADCPSVLVMIEAVMSLKVNLLTDLNVDCNQPEVSVVVTGTEDQLQLALASNGWSITRENYQFLANKRVGGSLFDLSISDLTLYESIFGVNTLEHRFELADDSLSKLGSGVRYLVIGQD